MNAYVLTFFVLVTTVAGQFLFKKAAEALVGLSGVVPLLKLFLNPWFVSAVIIYALSTFVWVKALSMGDLSRLYPMLALGYIIVPLIGVFVFSEALTLTNAIGIGLVVVGVILVAL